MQLGSWHWSTVDALYVGGGGGGARLRFFPFPRFFALAVVSLSEAAPTLAQAGIGTSVGMIAQYVQKGHCASSSRRTSFASVDAVSACLVPATVAREEAEEEEGAPQAPAEADADADDDEKDDEEEACAVAPSARCTSSICKRRCSASYTVGRKRGRIVRRAKIAPHGAASVRLAKQHAICVAPRPSSTFAFI